MAHWLMKSEPSSYSWDDLVRDGGTEWDGVRNPTARINLRAMKVGDEAFFYHSMDERQVVGIMRITREARPDAKDPQTGERYDDVICVWVPSEDDKQALVQDEGSPWFTTPHFDGHPSVLIRESRLGELSRDELAEVIEDAWLTRASKRRAAQWLADHPNA